jgi:riboflavin kinase/FMN adenylyltransferase
MRIYRHYETLPDEVRNAAIAIGNFDGVHIGHEAVIKEAGLIARQKGIPWAVLTFEPHPSSVFQADRAPFRLTPFRAKAHALEKLGVDAMIVQRFNRAFSQRPAEDFVVEVLVKGFGAHHIVSGYDFVFGHKRGGNCELLLSMGQGHGFGFTAVSAVESPDGKVYSSTGVRACLSEGDVKGAQSILGRPYAIEGRVAPGEQLGRTLGFPTANIHLGQGIVPKRGIYAVRVEIFDDQYPTVLEGVANIGNRPTVNGTGDLLEVFIFNFDKNLYGKRLRVSLIDFIRPEIKFDGLDSLTAEMAIDAEKARQILDMTEDK